MDVSVFDPRYLIIGRSDVYANTWLLWHSFNSFMSGTIPGLYFTHHLFHPVGTSLIFNVRLSHALVSAGVTALGGPVLAYNSLVIATTIATFAGLYVFLRFLTRHTAASVLGAMFFAFGTYRLRRMTAGHLNLLGTEWIAVFLYCFFRYFRSRQDIRWFGGMTASFILQVYTDIQTGVMLAILAAAMFIAKGFQQIRNHDFPSFGISLMAFMAAVLIGVTPLLMTVWPALNSDYRPDATEQQLRSQVSSSDLVSFVMPFRKGRTAYLGIVPLVLALVGFLTTRHDLHARRTVKGFVAAGLGFMLLSFGTELTVYGYRVADGWIMPFRWISDIPGLVYFHEPVRFVAFTAIAFSVPVAFAIRFISRHMKPGMNTWILFILIAIGLLGPGFRHLEIPITRYRINALSEAIRLGPPGAVLALPYVAADSFRMVAEHEHQEAMMLQTLYGKPLIGGYMTFIDSRTRESLQSDPVLEHLRDCQNGALCEPLPPRDVWYLRNTLNIRYITFAEHEVSDRMRILMDTAFPDAIRRSLEQTDPGIIEVRELWVLP